MTSGGRWSGWLRLVDPQTMTRTQHERDEAPDAERRLRRCMSMSAEAMRNA